MDHIIPYIWFECDVHEAVSFYTSIIPKSKIVDTITYKTPIGTFDEVHFELNTQRFIAMGNNTSCQLNEAISLIINISKNNPQYNQLFQSIWNELTDGGEIITPLGHYDFSERFGWVRDKNGLHFQVNIVNEELPMIVPCLTFSHEEYGKAYEAKMHYFDIFEEIKLGVFKKHRDHTIKYADFMLNNMWLAVIDNRVMTNAHFNEAFSLLISVDTQEAVHYYHNQLSAHPEKDQCGWLKDAYGLSWQVVPTQLTKMMKDSSEDQRENLVKAFLSMKRFDIEALKSIIK